MLRYQWTSVHDRMPDPDEHPRVLIYTEGTDFAGEQFFDVKTDTLNENYYEDPADQPEVCAAATHWMPLPVPNEHGQDCWCKPALDSVEKNGLLCGWLVIHNAADGREQYETGQRNPQ